MFLSIGPVFVGATVSVLVGCVIAIAAFVARPKPTPTPAEAWADLTLRLRHPWQAHWKRLTRR